jgi:4-hydroxyacetophenone monooxygenase
MTLPPLAQANDDVIRQVLAQADPMVLRGLLFQLTGDPELEKVEVERLPGILLPAPAISSPEGEVRVRELAFTFLTGLRDAGVPDVGLGPHDRLGRSLELAGGEDLRPNEVEFWTEELGLNRLERRHEWQHDPSSLDLDAFEVVVIGSGISGINAAIHLKDSGFGFTVLEKNADVGGCWHENRYPGARVDVVSRAYSHSFAADYPWTHWFSPQGENEAYLQWAADEFGIREHIQFGVDVAAMTWDEDAGQWQLTAVRDGEPVIIRAHAVVSAVGLLSRAQLPEFDGLDEFRGTSMHTTMWDQDFEPDGKRIAVVGTGASGLQVAPELSRRGASVTVYQRTPSWIFWVDTYRDQLPEEYLWLLANVPYFSNFDRMRALWSYGDHVLAHGYFIDHDFVDEHSLSATQKIARDACLATLERKLGHDPELLARSTPQYPPMSTRLVLDNGWLDQLADGTIELVSGSVVRVSPDGLLDEHGDQRDFDAIVWATGFRANDFLWPMEVTGRGGKRLADVWSKDGARAHLGITVPGFPNLFIMYGPNTNAGQGTLPPTLAEMQTRYILQALELLASGAARTIDVRQQVYDDYNALVDEKMKDTIYLDARANSYFTDGKGRSITQSPWLTQESWDLLRHLRVDDFDLS